MMVLYTSFLVFCSASASTYTREKSDNYRGSDMMYDILYVTTHLATFSNKHFVYSRYKIDLLKLTSRLMYETVSHTIVIM